MKIAALGRWVRHIVHWHRRLVATVLTMIAAAAALTALAPPPPDTEAVVVTAREVPAGRTLVAADLRVTQRPVGSTTSKAPRAIEDVAGRRLLTALPAGAVVLRELTLTADDAVPPGRTLVPFRLADPAVAGLLRVGDRVTVVGTGPTGQTEVVAARVRVHALPREDAEGGPFAGSSTPATLVVAETDTETGRRLAAWATNPTLSVTWE